MYILVKARTPSSEWAVLSTVWVDNDASLEERQKALIKASALLDGWRDNHILSPEHSFDIALSKQVGE